MGVGKGSGSGIGTGCGKCILIFVNIVFGLIGTVLLGLGVFLKVGSDMIKSFLQGALDMVPGMGDLFSVVDEGVNQAEDALKSGGASELGIDIGAILGGAAIALIILGLFLLIVSILGCCGACCSNKILLIVYGVIVLVIFLVQMILIICLFTGTFEGELKNQLMTLLSKYKGFQNFGTESLLWSVGMMQLKCCGVESYLDFQNNANDWQRTITVTRTVHGVKYNQTVTLLTPMPCCKFDGEFPSATPIDENCAITPSDLNNNWKTGCYGELVKMLKTMEGTALGVSIGILLFQLILGILAILIAVLQDKGKVGV